MHRCERQGSHQLDRSGPGGNDSQKRGFHFVVSSLAAYRGLPTSGPYSASKAAVSTLIESLRVDHYRTDLTFTAIHPGFVKTPLTDAVSYPTLHDQR